MICRVGWAGRTAKALGAGRSLVVCRHRVAASEVNPKFSQDEPRRCMGLLFRQVRGFDRLKLHWVEVKKFCLISQAIGCHDAR